MFRNQYDSDVTVWSPQGRLHQVEYAMEAVKLGLATVGLKSKTHALLVAFKKAPSELSSYQKKMFTVDNHIGISVAGITADARILCRYLRQECMGHTFTFNEPYPVTRIVSNLGNKIQVSTQRYDRRPYGVGLLIAGYDDNGPHIFLMDPSANFFNCKAMSIGSRSQSAKTYLEKHLGEFQNVEIDVLIQHGLHALNGTLGDKILSKENVSIGYVSKGQDFKILSMEENDVHISTFKNTAGAEPAGGAAPDVAAPIDGGADPAPDQPRPSGAGGAAGPSGAGGAAGPSGAGGAAGPSGAGGAAGPSNEGEAGQPDAPADVPKPN